MQKLALFSVVFLTLMISCGKINPPISISGKINCPSRTLKTLNPADYTIYLVDSLNASVSNSGKFIQPNADCTYAFDNLDFGHTYFLSVNNNTPKYGSKLPLSSAALEKFINNNSQTLVFNLSLLAADINLDGVVNGRDLIALNEYISGKTANFPGVFWHFQQVGGIDARNNFIPSVSPELSRMKKTVTNYDFIQVQAGDVDLTYCK